MPITIDLSGKTALITGASQGIGETIARRFHEAGATVLINHPGVPQTGTDADRLAKELGANAHVFAADVCKPDQVEAMMERISDEHGGIDFLINNAAILRDRTLAKMSLEEWQSVIDVNLSGVFYCSKFALPLLREGGAIVSMGSIAGIMGFPGQCNYAAAKSGVMSMMRVISREVAKRGIRANAIAPGVIETTMAATIPEEVRAGMLKNIPMSRFGKPEEIADAALFLCSPLSCYITGQTLEVNGGWRG